jgi:hypothetical protein
MGSRAIPRSRGQELDGLKSGRRLAGEQRAHQDAGVLLNVRRDDWATAREVGGYDSGSGEEIKQSASRRLDEVDGPLQDVENA